ncbi:septal ring lytic transglycosylase RlpA family protein [Sphingobium boeckii]|uniref:Endolytic peptidoglycan transglycosylase RlpA n=1 Tax=Sphingobium boeckii TaxID=1082345 RepID=A0A7W9AKU9_9SPHN|nr:septal ring lytic transglycosylase RlpA family protein [Sphingobium boeckii]MBB5687312.1 rare lipoprotein A [Sphingobium boeckii]
MTAACALLILCSCAVVDRNGDRTIVQRPLMGVGQGGIVSDNPVKIGQAYEAGGKTYVPADIPNYDEVGYASWYGDELRGGSTANGEAFNPDGISAAHRTLPLPSYVEVTALDTGRTILVRINDRGPFSGDRLIDLSQGAARQLGIAGTGHAPVRVRRVNPPEQERSALRAGAAAPERLESPKSLLVALRRKLGGAPIEIVTRPAPRPSATALAQAQTAKPTGRFIIEEPAKAAPPQLLKPKTAPTKPAAKSAITGTWYVQLGAFSSAASADALAKRAGARTDVAGKLRRVRFGPFPSEAQAKEALRSANAKGYREARLSRDAGR